MVAYDAGDYATALRLWRPLAERENAFKESAQIYLGIMYLGGDGVLQDYVKAHMWFNLASSRNRPVPPALSSEDAPIWEADRELREVAVKMRNLVAAKITPAQIAEAQQMAREWKIEPAFP